MNKIMFFLLLMAGVFLTPMPVSAAPAWTPGDTNTITYRCISGCSGDYVHRLNVSAYDQTTGVFSGTGEWLGDPSYTWVATGTLTQSDLVFRILYTGTQAGFAVDNTGTVDASGNASGTGVSNTGSRFTWTLGQPLTPGCRMTGFARDGKNLTAAVVNPTSPVTGTVDATGCNIGIYFSGNGSVDGATVFGADYFGVVADGSANGLHVDVARSTVRNIGETPFNGSQHGVGIYFYGLGNGIVTGSVSDSAVYAYQKGGITVNGARATVEVTGNTVTGLGKADFIAQNGIQFGWNANGTVRGNDISGNFYTGSVGVGPNAGGVNPPGWEYTSAGLLLYQSGDVKHAQNRYSGNQKNVSVAN